MIGWHHALKGFLSKRWTILATTHGMDSKAIDPRNAGMRCIKSVIHSFHEHTRRLWFHRNSLLHSSEIAETADIRSQELAEIKFYHSNPHLLLSTDQHHCNRSLPRLLSSSSATRGCWLRIVKRSSAELTKDDTRQTRITRFFTIPAPLIRSLKNTISRDSCQRRYTFVVVRLQCGDNLIICSRFVLSNVQYIFVSLRVP